MTAFYAGKLGLKPFNRFIQISRSVDTVTDNRRRHLPNLLICPGKEFTTGVLPREIFTALVIVYCIWAIFDFRFEVSLAEENLGHVTQKLFLKD